MKNFSLKIASFFVSIFLASSIEQYPQTVQALNLTSAQVTRIIDGDTLEVIASDTGTFEKIRIACIDAPDREQGGYYIQSKERLEQIIPPNTTIFLKDTKTRSHGRIVAEVFLSNRSIGVQMVREGKAIVYCRHLDSCPTSKKDLIKAEAAAMKTKLGVWQGTLNWTELNQHPCHH